MARSDVGLIVLVLLHFGQVPPPSHIRSCQGDTPHIPDLIRPSYAHLPADPGQDARSVEVAVLSVDAGGGGATDRARVRRGSVAEHGGPLLESLGPECAASGAACL